MRVMILGGTGQIGSRLVPQLQKRGDTLVLLSRNAARARQKLGEGFEYIEGDPLQPGDWMKAVSGCDAVINLVGEGIFSHRWTDAFKQRLRDSRIRSTEHVAAAIQQAAIRPAVLVQGTAIGYYGCDRGDAELTENDAPGNDFLAQLCVDWENAARPVEAAGTRLVLLRTGVVLDPQGGTFPLVILPFKLVLFGGPIGTGRQWVAWIHYADEVGLILWALDNPQVAGPLNATAPEPVTNRQLAQFIGQALHRPSFWPTPGFLPRLALGERADLVLHGPRVLPRKALDRGYRFQYPSLPAALAQLLNK